MFQAPLTPEVLLNHTGKNVADQVFQIIQHFEIENRIGYAVLDNSLANNIAMDHLKDLLGWGYQAGRARRGRCIGHTLNLSAKQLLFPSSISKVQDEDSSYLGPGSAKISNADWEQWCKFGSVGMFPCCNLDMQGCGRAVTHIT